MDDVPGTAGDDTINAPATNATTGANATTINSGDVVAGGAGDDTLNITISSTNNNSLSGLKVSGVETVNISGTNNLGTSSPALAAAQTAKAATALALANAQAASNLANGQLAAATAVEGVVNTLAGVLLAGDPPVEESPLAANGAAEFAVSFASTATADSAAARVAAARYFDEQTLVKTQEFLAAKAVAGLDADALDAARAAEELTLPDGATYSLAQYSAAVEAAETTTEADENLAAADAALIAAIKAVANVTSTEFTATGIKAFTLADYKAVAAATLVAKDGTKITGADDALERNAVLDSAWAAVNTLAASTKSTALEAAQIKAAADHVAGLEDAGDVSALATASLSTLTGSTGAYTVLNTTAFTAAQLSTAAKAAVIGYTGLAVTGSDIIARADELAAAATAVNDLTAGDFTIAQLNAAAKAALSNANGASLLTPGDDVVAIETRTDQLLATATTAATTAATAVTTAAANDAAAANNLTVALDGVAATTVSAAQFVGATQVWLKGADSSKTNVTGAAATQTIGFDAVTGMDNSVTFGATVEAGSIALKSAAGKLAVDGASIEVLNISGTGTTGLELTDTSDAITDLNVSTTGSTVLTVTGMSALETVVQTGAGSLSVVAATDVLASVTSGDGSDRIKLVTATAKDNPTTTVDETVDATVSSGGGNDLIVLDLEGAGKTVVDAGAGNDTIYLTELSTGKNSIVAGSGDDLIIATSISNLASTVISGGSGTDTLRTSTTAFTTASYAIFAENVSSIERLQLSGATTALDASKLSVSTLQFLADDSVVTGVQSSQNVIMSRTAKAAEIKGFVSAVGDSVPTGLSVTSKGYLPDSDPTLAGKQTVFGADLNVSFVQTSASGTLEAKGNNLTLTVSALAQSGLAADATTQVDGINTRALLTGDVKTATVVLASARGTGTHGLGEEAIATFSAAVTEEGGDQSANLLNLTSIKVSGAGSVTIDAGNLANSEDPNGTAPFAKLTKIDLSGMTAFADQNAKGQEVGDGGVGGYNNKSTSGLTLNDNISETVILGGARDTVTTSSTIAVRDVIEGFELVASVLDDQEADLDRSDSLVLGINFDGVKMVTTATTLNGALLQAAGYKVGSTDEDDVVFKFDGNTYIYSDLESDGLSDDDILVELLGSYDLDLLLSSLVASNTQL